MQELRKRRSCRLAVSIPICVYGTDYRGTDFTEEATTLVVNMYGAKIRLGHQLLPEQEIRLVSQTTHKDAVFRVISKVGGAEVPYTFWGVECLDPRKNIWGLRFPELEPRDQVAVRVMVQCPACKTRELIYLDEPLLESLQSTGGLTRGCIACRSSGSWRLIPYQES